MKQSDIFTILLIAVAGTAIAYFGLNAILGDPNSKSVSFKTITPVTASLSAPDPEVFNQDAINPTVEVFVGSCEDIDQNGILDMAELEVCGQPGQEVIVDANDDAEPEGDAAAAAQAENTTDAVNGGQ